MNIQNIASRVQLTTLSLGAWRATRGSRGESEKVNQAHGTGDAARVSVRLSSHPALGSLGKLHAEVYGAHRAITLPTIQDGFRLLPATRLFEHGETLAKFRGDHDRLAATFLADYEDEAATAPVRLNGLYDARQWPARHVIAEKFRFKSEYLPCPTNGGWSQWIAESARAAEAELSDRLREALARVVDRCGSDGKLYDTVFSNLKEVVDMVPDFNLAECPIIAAAAVRAAEIAALDADSLRDAPATRAATAAAAASILAAFGGAAS